MFDQDSDKLSALVMTIWSSDQPEQNIVIKQFLGDCVASHGITLCVTRNKAVWCVTMGQHRAVIATFMLRRGDSVLYAFTVPEILDKVEKLRPQFVAFKPDTKISRLEKRMAAIQNELAALKAEKAERQGFQLRA